MTKLLKIMRLLVILLPIFLWSWVVVGHHTDAVNIISVVLITVCAAAWLWLYSRLRVEDKHYDTHVIYKRDELNLTRKLFKERFNAN